MIVALVVMLVRVLGLFALVWWSTSGPPTRPRPGSATGVQRSSTWTESSAAPDADSAL
jgi:hypothetical protein